jgi:hypothetical protein
MIIKIWISGPESPRPQVEAAGRGLSGRRKSTSATRGTRIRHEGSFIFIIYHKTPQNKDFDDKILQNTCLGQNPMRWYLQSKFPFIFIFE